MFSKAKSTYRWLRFSLGDLSAVIRSYVVTAYRKIDGSLWLERLEVVSKRSVGSFELAKKCGQIIGFRVPLMKMVWTVDYELLFVGEVIVFKSYQWL